MENASKALLMAAGVLMGVAILTLAVFLYSSFGGTSEQIQKNIEKGQIEQFNNNFLAYTTKKCTIYDIISVANLANNYNTNQFEETNVDYYIKVEVHINSTQQKNLEKMSESDIFDIIKEILKNNNIGSSDYSQITSDGDENKFELLKFSCDVEYSELTGRVNHVIFKN